jgi:hypothetical protein
MPVKIGTLLLNLVKKAGYDSTLLAIPSEQFEIPDDCAAALENKLFTEDAAKNNQAIKAYFFKQALDGVDNGIVRLMDEYQLDDALRTEITGIKSTYDRFPTLVKKIEELQAAKAGASKGDKAILQDQINKLNQEKATLIAEKEKEIDAIRRESDDSITSFMVESSIKNAKLVTDQYDIKVMTKLANDFINTELKEQGAKVVKRDGALKLVKASDEALDFYADNKAVSFDEFRDSTLAKYKLIAVNAKPPVPQPGLPPTPPPGTPPAKPANTSYAAMLAQSQADLAKSIPA